MEDGWINRIKSVLIKRKVTQTYRKRRAVSGGNSRFICYKDRSYLNFSSNDYLGLAQHPDVIRSWQECASQEGIGSGGSGHISGYSCYHQKLEKDLAEWLGYSCAILFNSGYSANQAVIGALVKPGDHILADKLSHASLLDAAIKSPAELRRFSHNDLVSLDKLMQRNCTGNRLVITEGIFSMNGDRSPLVELSKKTEEIGGWLMVDDAHGIGVIGSEGKGCSWESNVQPNLLVVTFGKAVGVCGAALLCTTLVAEYLLQCSNHLIYSTSLPPAQVAAISTALMIIRNGDYLRKKLNENINYFRHGASTIGLNLLPSDTAIQPILIGNDFHALQFSEYLKKRGIWIVAIRSPTVPPNSSRLRVTITAFHKKGDIDILLEVLSDMQSYIHQKKINLSMQYKKEIARSFNKAALNYDKHAKFQRICGNYLCELAGNIKGRKILDAGCGTGWFSRYWKMHENSVIALDFSSSMLIQARQKNSADIYILGDIEKIPLATESIDVIFSNLVVQWCNNLSQALSELYRILRPGGKLVLSTLAHGSLFELEQAWKNVDDNVHINKFLTDSAISTAFSSYHHYLLTKVYHLHYSNVIDLLREIKGVGAGYLRGNRSNNITTKNRLKKLEENWPQYKSERGLSLSYRVVYGMLYRD